MEKHAPPRYAGCGSSAAAHTQIQPQRSYPVTYPILHPVLSANFQGSNDGRPSNTAPLQSKNQKLAKLQLPSIALPVGSITGGGIGPGRPQLCAGESSLLTRSHGIRLILGATQVY